MTTVTESIKDKIRGLLNIAKDDAASEAEIETALRIAQKMMERNHLSEEDLIDDPLTQLARAANAPKGKQSADLTTKVHTWEIMLAATIADDIIGGVGWFSSKTSTTPAGLLRRDEHGNVKTVAQITFFGVAEDVEIATRLYAEIRTAIIAMSRLRYGSVFRGDGAAYAEGFCLGLSGQAKGRKTEEHTEAVTRQQTTGDSTALVLVNRRNALIQQKHDNAKIWLASREGGGIRLRTASRSGSSGSGDARNAGRNDGAGYSVNGARTKKLC